jgi:DNA polymerase-4
MMIRPRFAEPILHVDMDAFFVEVERRRDPALVGRAVAVGGNGRRGVVAAASYEARRFGVRSAMPVVQARRLCRELVMVPADHVLYGRASREVFEVFLSFTPLVEKLSVDEAFLDVTGLRNHYRSVTEVGEAIRQELRKRLGLPASVGIAINKTIAKLASEDAKPDGLLRIRSEESLDFLHSLSVRRLWGVGIAMAARLHRLGIRTVGELAEVPADHLSPTVGRAAAEHLSNLAAGIDNRSIFTDPVGVSLSVENTFEHDLYHRSQVEVKLRVQAERLAGRLKGANVWSRTITLKVRFSDFSTITRSHTRHTPTRLAIDIYREVMGLVDRSGLEGKGVRLLGISASGLSREESLPKLDLKGANRWEDLEEEVFRLRRRFGFNAVLPARISPENEKSTQQRRLKG